MLVSSHVQPHSPTLNGLVDISVYIFVLGSQLGHSLMNTPLNVLADPSVVLAIASSCVLAAPITDGVVSVHLKDTNVFLFILAGLWLHPL